MSRLIPDGVRPRRGFTLTELMITVVLFGLVMAALMGVIVRQQRFYRGANEIIDTRSQMRQAASILPIDLRGTSSIGADIKSVSDSSVEFLANLGSGIICQLNGTQEFYMLPTDLTRHTLTSWYAQPVVGDSVFIYDEGALRGSEDDSWTRLLIDGVSTVTYSTACDGAPYATTTSADRGNRYRFHVASAYAGTVLQGSIVRFARLVRYRFYAGGDGQWYLGYQQYSGGAWSTVQPLSGPYRPYAANASSGLRLTYYNEAGTQLTTNDATTRASIARIDVSLKGIGANASNVALARGGQFRDSLLVRIAIRNRS